MNKNIKRALCCAALSLGFAIGCKAQILNPKSFLSQEGNATVINTSNIAKRKEGYGGPVPLKIYMVDRKVEKIEILPNKETPKYLAKVKAALFPKWIGLSAEEARKQDVDVVTGATLTSKAIIHNVKTGLRYYHEATGGNRAKPHNPDMSKIRL